MPCMILYPMSCLMSFLIYIFIHNLCYPLSITPIRICSLLTLTGCHQGRILLLPSCHHHLTVQNAKFLSVRHAFISSVFVILDKGQFWVEPYPTTHPKLTNIEDYPNDTCWERSSFEQIYGREFNDSLPALVSCGSSNTSNCTKPLTIICIKL